MARIFYLGAPTKVSPASAGTVAGLMQATGNNTGNLLIGHAIHRHLKIDALGTDLAMDPERINADFDCVVIGAANFIYPKFDFEPYARFLERIKLPCVIIGLGAQAPRYGTAIEVPEGTRRMLKIVSERSKTLGVRGIFTAATLVDMGITNVRMIGCPSMYWTCRPTLEFKPRVEPGAVQVAVNGSTNVVPHSANPESARRLESALVRLSFSRGLPYILQNESALMKIASGEESSPDPRRLSALAASIGLSGVPGADFVRYLREKTRTYSDVEQWYAAMKPLDLVVGSRFHGCLIALLAGVPACVFVHDARTREMCELLHLPHRNTAQVAVLDDLPSLYGALDLAATATAYRHLYQNYITFLDENKLEHRLTR